MPENAEDEVDFHYVCSVKSSKTGHLYEIYGDSKGAMDHGALKGGGDVLSEGALKIMRRFICREQGANVNFSPLALVRLEQTTRLK